MYAIIEDGGRQFKVEEGQEIVIDFKEEWRPDMAVTFDKVLMVSSDEGVKIGQPTVSGAKVTATVIDEVQGKKLTIRWFRRRKNSRKKVGHRQIYTKVKITKIEV
ncbi:MAG: 50S ribosomal protein L21 [Planctomycetaceae bacterium]|nr:50S ribosomal protein L21 [Planctomycetaceae bacterium]